MPPMLTRIATALLPALLVFALAPNAAALEITDRQVDLNGTLNIKGAQGVASKLMKLDAKSSQPIYLMVSSSAGTAQGVMIVADTIRSLESPVVAVVTTEVHGAGAAVVPFTDRAYLFRSSGLVFTELSYEGVKKPKPKTVDAPAKATKDDKKDDKDKKKAKAKKKAEPDKRTLLLQQARVRYLDRFYGRLAKRMFMGSNALKRDIDNGGLIMTADEAVKKKIAYALVDTMRYRQLPVTKKERKLVRTQKMSRQVSPDNAGEEGSN